MQAEGFVPIEEYLRTAYRPDCDYVDGVVVERCLGEFAHARLQAVLGGLLLAREREWGVVALTSVRVRVSETRVRVPDLCLLDAALPREQVITRPPVLCVEILSPEDRMSRIQERVDEYLEFGVFSVWVLDPVLRRAYLAAREDGLREVVGERLWVAGRAEIGLRLADVFAER